MLQKMCLSSIVLSLAIAMALAADVDSAPGNLTVAQIVDRSVSAQGGLQTWRAVKAMSVSGKLDAGGKQSVQLPFVLESKRPRKTRLEIEFNGQTAVQVYDGVNGWKLRPFLNRHEVEPFTPEEMKAASMQADLDGLLVDYGAKGSKIELAGVENLEGRDAYNLKLTMKGDEIRHVWVDTKTFLELKIEGVPRRLNGKNHAVATYLRDYRSVQGLMIPYVVETAVEGVKGTHKMTVEKVVVNPKLDDSHFAKPL
jgi:outer membrane lipoprotein-sorting protein